MKRFKYQALITLSPPRDGTGDREAVLPGPACRMVVRARHHETGHHRLFSALVSPDQRPSPGRSQVIVRMVLLGDDANDCLAPGETFALWREGYIGDGVVTRRLFV